MATSEAAPDSAVRITDFLGLVLEVDEHDLKQGASHFQVNATSENIGSLISRRGIQVVAFDGE